MPRIVVASTNPVKIQAALNGFTRMFPDESFTVEGVSVPSGVPDQPMSDAETLQGALNRARNARHNHPDADFWAGIEGGIEDVAGEMECFAWIVVLSNGRIGKARTGAFYLPQEVAELVRQGVELGEADDRYFQRSDSKRQNGSIGLLTDDLIDRTLYYEQAVIMALIPFKHTQLTFGGM